MARARETPIRATSIPQPNAGNDDLSRDVYCVLGIPIDNVDFATALRRIEQAAKGQAPFLLSTPNLNFLVNAHASAEFRDSLLLSDLCPPDSVAILWLARLLGVPIKERVAGSDLFEALKHKRPNQPIRVFLFGGEAGVAQAAAAQFNASGVVCVGNFYPGFGSVEEMMRKDILVKINSSNAQFLVVSLGAVKGQSWLLRNHSSLRIPLRSHLGAVMNFQAGTVKRAPPNWRRLGVEWLWRIKEEPYLWSRYAHDGLTLLRLLLTRIVPLRVDELWLRARGEFNEPELTAVEQDKHDSITLRLKGVATAKNIHQVRDGFAKALGADKKVILELSELRVMDARALGLLLMLRKQLQSRGLDLQLVGMNRRLKKTLRLQGLDFLLSCSPPARI